MNAKILVTYASKYGATREIAERIGTVLNEAGLMAEVLPIQSVQTPGAYQAVVLGSGVYVGKWLKEAVAFVQRHEKALAERPAWFFSSGPSGEGDPLQLVEGWRLPNDIKATVERIGPQDVTVFHGSINPEKLNGMEKFAVKNIVKKPFGDYRDWNMITAWAEGVAAALQKV